ncbi:MAG: efflux RND transporter periplasmic adaptor subunit [Pseudomonadota bacterium]
MKKSAWILTAGLVLGLAAGVLAPRSLPGGLDAAAKARDFVAASFSAVTRGLASGGDAARPANGRGQGGGGRRGFRPVVTMEAAEAASIARKVEVIGEARARRAVAITAEVAGLVEAINIASGTRVAEGDVLVQIDDDEQQVALARARADYPIARDNAARYRDLESDAAASELEAEQAQSNFVAAEAALRAAEVAVALRKIRAPFDGIAGLTDLEVGDYVRVGDVVTTLDDTSSIVVEFSVPQEAAGFVNIGQAVEAKLTSDVGVSYAGEITAIDSRVDAASRTLRVEAQVENVSNRLIPGAVLAVSTTAEGEPAIAAPGLAVQWDRSGAFVWRRNEEGLAERARVVILQRTDDQVLVEGDLKAGDVIAVEGADRVRSGFPLPDLPTAGGGVAAAAAL